MRTIALALLGVVRPENWMWRPPNIIRTISLFASAIPATVASGKNQKKNSKPVLTPSRICLNIFVKNYPFVFKTDTYINF